MAKVTIVVPIYNVEEYLPKCLDSLISQTFKDIEIWAISDGSPDNSVSIVKQYSAKDDRVKCIEKENGGYGSVLEYAIKNIHTEYFLICDPDDWLLEDAIEILYKKATGNNLDLVYGSYYFVYSNDNETQYSRGSNKEIFEPISNVVYDSEIENFWFLAPNPHAKLYKTKMAKNIKFPHEVSFTDTVLYMLFVGRAKRVMHIDQALAYYLIDREGNTMTDVKPQIADAQYAVFKTIWEQYETYDNKKDCFYYKMYMNLHYAIQEIAKIKDRKSYDEKTKMIYELVQLCLSKRKLIKNQIKNKGYLSTKKKTFYTLLLMPIFSKTFYKHYVNKAYLNAHGGQNVKK